MRDAEGMNRRAFLRGTASVGAGVAASLAAGAPAAGAAARHGNDEPATRPKTESRNVQPGVVYRRLGRTNLMLSALTYGGVRLKPDGLDVFEACVGKGVNFIMAHAGGCTKALGEWFKTKGNRERVFVGLRPRSAKNIDRELKTMGIECVDLLMLAIHKPKAAAREEVREQFEALRKAGKARYLCLVFHSNVPDVFRAGVEAGWYDVLLPTYNLPTRKDLQPLLASAKAKDIGLLTMKSARGLGKGQGPVAACKRFLADGIDAVVRSIPNPAALKKILPIALEADDTPPLKAAAGTAGQCTLCGACRDCPEGLAIQDILRTYQYYALDLGDVDHARDQYAAIPLDRLATACSDCGRCEVACPHDLPIRQLIREADLELGLEFVGRRHAPIRT